MKRLRILPEIWARTRWSLASATRNIVPGSTDVIVPSRLIAFSESMIVGITGENVGDAVKYPVVFREAGCFPYRLNQSTGDCPQTGGSRRKDGDALRAAALH